MNKPRIISAIVFLLSILSLTMHAQWISQSEVNTAIETTTGDESFPKVVSSTLYPGISYVCWASNQNGNRSIYLQKLAADGSRLWNKGGILVNNHSCSNANNNFKLIIDANDCAIIIMQSSDTDNNILLAYKISPDGTFMWGSNGIQLSGNASLNAMADIIHTNSGNTIVAWIEGDNIHGQKISSSGILKWGEDGIVITESGNYSWPQLLPVGNDNVILKYFEENKTDTKVVRNIYAQRLLGNGDKSWQQATVISNTGMIYSKTAIVPIIEDGNDGFYIAWSEDRNGSLMTNVLVQHINTTGQILYKQNGIEASINGKVSCSNPQLVLYPGLNDVFIFWDQKDAINENCGISGQKISASGTIQWGNVGKEFIVPAKSIIHCITASTSEKDLFIFYEENPDMKITDIKVIGVDASGSFIWPSKTITISNANSKKINEVVSNYNFGQWLVIWEDDRRLGKNIYGQNIKSDGSLGSISPIFNADFTVSSNRIKEKEEVQFTDKTPGKVISWEWHFEGGIPETSFDQNQSVTYNSSGLFDVELIVSDGDKTDTTLRIDYIIVDNTPQKTTTQTETPKNQKNTSKKEPSVKINSNGKFLIVVGCFAEKNNANQLIRELKNKGFDTSLAGTNKYSMIRVAINAGNDREEALKKLSAIRKHDYPEAWLLVK